MMHLSLYTVIVNHGLGSKVVNCAHNHDIHGATIMHGKGTVNKGLLSLLGINETRKDIIFMISDDTTGDEAMFGLYHQFHMEKPKHGIIFKIPLKCLLGSKKYKDQCNPERKAKSMPYEAVFTIVERGKAEEVISAATSVGVYGGTIINARGSSVHETAKIFNIPIEPEKEIVLIVAKTEDVDKINDVICKELGILEPGQGILFTLPVERVLGLFDHDNDQIITEENL